MTCIVENARSRRIEESPTLAIAAKAAQMKAAGKDVVSLGAGEPDFATPAPIAAAGIRAIETGNYRYTAAAGIKPLRAAGAKWLSESFGLAYSPDEVMVCAGAKAALHMSLQAIVEPGQSVLVLAPHWVSYPALVTLAGGEPVILPPAPERGLVHDGDTILRAARAHDAKGLVLNFPNNPSGAVASRDEIAAIVDAAAAAGLWSLSDEIYATLLYDGARHTSPAAVPGGRERTIVVNGFTKSHTLTGWRTSFLAAPQPIVDACTRLQSQVLGNPCTISQAAMLAACELPDPAEQQRRMASFDERRRFLVEQINRIPGLHLAAPRGAFYALVDARELCAARGIDDFVMCQQLLEQHLLAGVPGSAFGIPDFVRFSYAAAMGELRAGVERLRAYAEAR
jgi:aspartate aminotransferase